MREDADEPLYTLAEARRVIAASECGVGGHDFEVLRTYDGQPLTILCIRGCGAGPWSVVANPKREIKIQNARPLPCGCNSEEEHEEKMAADD